LCGEAKRIIEKLYGDAVTMRARLKSLGVNETHLSRLFLKLYGVTPYRYMSSLRVSKAREMISGGGSIADTAYECGYGSLTAFYNDFKGVTGMTPGQFRQSIQIGLKHTSMP
jgi:AraC family transcriptional regulator of adaptative response / methylphosphotriester-DNA alkyltransferase methyltransferase